MRTSLPWLWLAVATLASPALASDGPTWDPARTHALVVSVVTWKDPALSSFTRPRLDDDLVETLVAAGVPRANVTFLKDEQATLAAVRRGLSSVATRAGPGTTLFVYFQGHGLRSQGATTLATYDIDTRRAETTGLTVAELGATLEQQWKGERLVLFGDACHSGALGGVALRLEQARGAAVKTAALTSTVGSNRSTGFWTFTEGLIALFAGDPVLDRDGSGAITFEEADRFLHDEMKFAERQLAQAVRGDRFEPRFVFRATAGSRARRVKGPWQVGDYVQALDQADAWYGARVIEAKATQWKVHFPGWDPKWDLWVGPDAVRPVEFGKLEVGRRYQAEWKKGQWYDATVVRAQDDAFYFVHYEGEAGDDDEWVTAERVRPAAGASGPTTAPAAFTVGQGVAALWKGHWYLATLTTRAANGAWTVHYADDTVGLVKAPDLRPLAPQGALTKGARVLACWEGKPRMFPGVVAGTEGGRVRVAWDDGGKPSLVELTQVALP